MDFKKKDREYILRLDQGEEIIEKLREFCKNNNIQLGIVLGIGEVNKAKIGVFDNTTREYQAVTLKGSLEITNLTGNISTKSEEPYLNLKINLADTKFNVYGGRFFAGTVSGSCELYIKEIEGQVQRKFNKETGVNIFQFE